MATQRLLEPARVGDGRKSDSLVQIISILGARRRELKASVDERLLLLDARTSAFESRHVQLEARLASAEGNLERLDQARVAVAHHNGLRRERSVHLRQQLEILRTRAAVTDSGEVRHTPGPNAAMHRFGSVLMYIGGLLVLWVVLLELGLAFGLS